MRDLGEAGHAVAALAKRARSISFSQYAEDILLAVTLLPTGRGFYVDVGAYHPWQGSNTYKLYLRGWRGLTIEPNPMAASGFRAVRPRDIHVTAGVAERAGELTYHIFDDGKLNTFAPEQAEIYARAGSPPQRTINVGCLPLQAIIDREAPGAHVDLLSIDCEGFDVVALKSLDFAHTRPTVIMIEDFGAFETLRTGVGASEIQVFLRAHGYQPIGQALYSSLYVDRQALEDKASTAFRLESVQFS